MRPRYDAILWGSCGRAAGFPEDALLELWALYKYLQVLISGVAWGPDVFHPTMRNPEPHAT